MTDGGFPEQHIEHIDLHLTVDEADAMHGELESLLEEVGRNSRLEVLYRHLGWKLAATRTGEGFAGTLARMAQEADTLEEYEAARDEWLGPIIGGLENQQNRDP